MKLLRIATRQSPLALWQAESVKKALLAVYPTLKVEIIGMLTEGDTRLGSSLSPLSGKGSFVKALEEALLEDRADIAVHSIKDLPGEFPPGLMLATIGEREDPRDAFVSNDYPNVTSLPPRAKVGTASLRRQCQLHALRPDLEITTLRGNVGSRLNRLDNGDFAAIILAAAGLIRLNYASRIRHYFSPQEMLPAPGQGALGIECRQNDEATLNLIEPLEHSLTRVCVSAERAMSKLLEGGCRVPIAAYGRMDGTELFLQGLVGHADGHLIIRSEIRGAKENAETLGEALAHDLLSQGAKDILKAYGN